MNFGLGIGDVIATLELVNRIRRHYVGAPSQFKSISEEIRNLSITLNDLNIVLSEDKLNDRQQGRLLDIFSSCLRVLRELEKTTAKYQDIISKNGSLSQKAKRVWKRLNWEPEDIRDLRGRIVSNIALLNTLLVEISSQTAFDTKQVVDQLKGWHQDSERLVILNWLTTVDYGPQQSDFIDQRQAGTANWLLQSSQYQGWVKSNGQTLFCPGIPGAGKTTLTAVTIDDLTGRFRDSDIGIAYLYCNFRRRDEQQANDLLASLLKQLCQARPSLPNSLLALFEQHSTQRTRPSLVELSQAIRSVTLLYLRVFIVVDGLDECQVENGCRSSLLSDLFNLQVEHGINLFATSRFIPEIVERFKESTSVEIRATEEDVRRYVEGHISRLPSFVQRDQGLLEDIKVAIVQSVEGMFLLAKLHLDALIGKRSPRAIRNALSALPTGSGAYDQAYGHAMDRIEGQLSDQEELAKQVLSWVTCSERPLGTLELQQALAVEVGDVKLDEDNIPQIEDMVSVCAGLVTVDEESGIIRLVHYTTEEYFQRTQLKWFPTAQAEITTNCITYLSFDVFQDGYCHTDEEFETRLRTYQLYSYAAHNWGRHARQVETLGDEVMNFLHSNEKVEASSQAMIATRRWSTQSSYSTEAPQKMTGLHLVSYFGIEQLGNLLIMSTSDVDLKNSHGCTPLLLAAKEGNEAVVRLLLAQGAETNSKDNSGQTPLSWAARRGHEDVARLLLDQGTSAIELKDTKHCQTPLIWAAEGGHVGVVKLLLDRHAKIESRTKSGQTPLSKAAKGGYETIVRLLLDRGAQIESRDKKYGRSPLLWAVEGGFESTAKLLLSYGAKVESKSSWGDTSLSGAAAKGYESIIRLLLQHGAAIEARNNSGQTPLSRATEGEHGAVIRLLLEQGADSESRSKSGQTPLSWAAARGCDFAVCVLLDYGSNIESNSDSGQTPLSWAAMRGQGHTTMLLLDQGADIESKSSSGQTALSWAATRGHEASVRTLLDKGAEIESTNNWGQTPLSRAAEGGHEAIVRLLILDYNAEVESKDKTWGQTPLLWAATKGHPAVVQLLLDQGAKIESKSKSKQTSLSRAATRGHAAVVRILLENGADVECKSSWGQTPLSCASEGGHEDIVQLLLAWNGVDLNAENDTKRTPLTYAAQMGHDKVVMALLGNKQVESDLKDYYGSTPLSIAARHGRTEVVNLLLATQCVDYASRDCFGRTPLWHAKRSGNIETVDVLVEHARVNGIPLDESDRRLEGSIRPNDDACRWCDVCTMSVQGDIYYECGACSNADFTICLECYDLGGLCLKDDHALIARNTSKDTCT